MDLSDDEDVVEPTIVAKSKSPPQDLTRDGEERRPTVVVESAQLPSSLTDGSEPMVVVSKGPDELAKDGEEGQPMDDVESKGPDGDDDQTLVGVDSKGPDDDGETVVGADEDGPPTNEVDPAIDGESNDMLVDSHPSVSLQAPFAPRRSSRKAAAKTFPMANSFTPRKSLGGKKKPTPLMKDVLNASLQF